MKVVNRIVLLCLTAVLLLPAHAGAEKQNSDMYQLNEMVVTATKHEISTREVPASVTVIGREALDLQSIPNADISDALRTVPGITIRRAYAPFPASANIRGAGSDATIYLVNGIPTDWQISQAIPVELVEKVEIIRGPASALYGANASGGVVNIILKEGGAETTGELRVGVGSFDRYRFSGSVEGDADAFRYAAAVYYEESAGTNVVHNNVNPGIHMIDDCEYDKAGAGGTAGYNFSDRSMLRVFYNFYNNAYTRGRPYVGGDWDYHLAGLIYDHGIGENLNITGSVAYRTDDYLHLYDKGGTNYDPRQKRFMDYSELPLELRATLSTRGGHTVTAGAFYNNQETEQKYHDWVTGVMAQENDFKVKTIAGYLQDVWRITDTVTLTPGLRYDRWENYDNYFSNFIMVHPADRTDDHLSPKIGLRWNVNEGTSLWTNYGTGFKPPTSEQLYDDRTSGGNPRQPNPDLKSETTQSYEIGLEQWFGDRVRTELVGFYNETDDKILSWFDVNNIWVNKNIGQSRSYGAEFTLSAYLTENWILTANYTYDRATIEKNPQNLSLEGNDLPFSPEHKANLGIKYSRPGNFTIGASVRYLSDQFSNDANTDRNASGEQVMMPESIAVDLKGTKRFSISRGFVRSIDVSISVDNLFDEEYRSFYMYEDPGTVVFSEVAMHF